MAISKASATKRLSMFVLMDHPTTIRESKSSNAAKYKNPSEVEM
jgi:hypothetical protein